jgi:hypothetical protein
MSIITLDSGLNWLEIIPLTPEQLAALETSTPEKAAEIAGGRLKPATTDDAKAGQALYEQHKVEGATLIACDITLPSGSGIINCRVDGEHAQIRF